MVRDLQYTSQRLGLRASCLLSWENKLLWYVWDNSYAGSSRDLSVVFAWIPELSPESAWLSTWRTQCVEISHLALSILLSDSGQIMR